jgi:hypothetical protein
MDVLKLLLAVAAAVLLFYKPGCNQMIAWLTRRRFMNSMAPLKPTLTMEEAWNGFIEGVAQRRHAKSDELKTAYNMLNDSQRQDLKLALLEQEEKAAHTENPMEAIRLAFMDWAIAAFLADEIAGLSNEDQALLASHFGEEFSSSQVQQKLALFQVAIVLLSNYLKIKYDDCVGNDWSEYFYKMAKGNTKAKVNLMLSAARHPQDSSYMMLYEAYPELSKMLKNQLVHCPRRTALKYESPDDLPPLL